MALLRLVRGEAGPARECWERFLSAEFTESNRLARNVVPMPVFSVRMACMQHQVAAASKMHSILSKTSTPHAAGASGGSYLVPSSYWLGLLSLTLGEDPKPSNTSDSPFRIASACGARPFALGPRGT